MLNSFVVNYFFMLHIFYFQFFLFPHIFILIIYKSLLILYFHSYFIKLIKVHTPLLSSVFGHYFLILKLFLRFIFLSNYLILVFIKIIFIFKVSWLPFLIMVSSHFKLLIHYSNFWTQSTWDIFNLNRYLLNLLLNILLILFSLNPNLQNYFVTYHPKGINILYSFLWFHRNKNEDGAKIFIRFNFFEIVL